MKGIDKRTGKDGAISYRARVCVKGHPPITKTFNSYTLAKKWKKNTEVEIDTGRYYENPEEQEQVKAHLLKQYLSNGNPLPAHQVFIQDAGSRQEGFHNSFLMS